MFQIKVEQFPGGHILMLLPFFLVRWTRKSYVEDSFVFLNGIVYFVILYNNKKKYQPLYIKNLLV